MIEKFSIGGAFIVFLDDIGRTFGLGQNHRGQLGLKEST